VVLRRRCNGAKHTPEALALQFTARGRGAFYLCRSQIVRFGGTDRRDYADMSNDKIGEKPIRRKPKVSWVKLICSGLVGP